MATQTTRAVREIVEWRKSTTNSNDLLSSQNLHLRSFKFSLGQIRSVVTISTRASLFNVAETLPQKSHVSMPIKHHMPRTFHKFSLCVRMPRVNNSSTFCFFVTFAWKLLRDFSTIGSRMFRERSEKVGILGLVSNDLSGGWWTIKSAIYRVRFQVRPIQKHFTCFDRSSEQLN